MTVQLTKAQSVIYQNPTRFRILVAGRRFGKSFLAAVELISKASKKSSLNYYIAPTYKMAKSILWRDIKRLVPPELLYKTNESELTLTLINDSVIRLVGADNPDALRGVSLSFAVLDEFAFMKEELWTEVIRPALSDKKGHAMFITTPCGLNWAYDLYSDSFNYDDWYAKQYTTIEGGNVDAEEIESAKKQLSQKQFAQEYLASFETIGNRAYYAFDRNIHVSNDLYLDTDQIFIGMDFNVSPMSAVICTVAGSQLHIIDEIILNDSNTTEICQAIEHRYPGKRITVYPDPSGKARKTSAQGNTDFSIIESFGYVVDAPKAAPRVEHRIENTNRLFKNAKGEVNAYVHPKCTYLIKCLEGLTYKPGGDRIPDKSLNIDHAPDALGYLAWQKFPPVQRELNLDVRIF